MTLGNMRENGVHTLARLVYLVGQWHCLIQVNDISAVLRSCKSCSASVDAGRQAPCRIVAR